MVLAPVVEGSQRLRMDALDVPHVEELVGDQLEEALVGSPRPESEAVDEENSAVAMLEPSAAGGEVMDERVALVRHAAEELALRPHDGARVFGQACLVFVAAAPERDLVRHPVDF